MEEDGFGNFEEGFGNFEEPEVEGATSTNATVVDDVQEVVVYKLQRLVPNPNPNPNPYRLPLP